MLLIIRNKLQINSLNKSGPNIEPYGIPDKISCHELKIYIYILAPLFLIQKVGVQSF